MIVMFLVRGFETEGMLSGGEAAADASVARRKQGATVCTSMGLLKSKRRCQCHRHGETRDRNCRWSRQQGCSSIDRLRWRIERFRLCFVSVCFVSFSRLVCRTHQPNILSSVDDAAFSGCWNSSVHRRLRSDRKRSLTDIEENTGHQHAKTGTRMRSNTCRTSKANNTNIIAKNATWQVLGQWELVIDTVGGVEKVQ